MVFSSTFFLFVYLPVVLFIYYVTPIKFRNLVLLIFSLIFYGWGEPIYIGMMIISTLIDYVCGMLVERYRHNKKQARLAVLASVVLNLTILFFFKYYDFFISTLTHIPMFSNLKALNIPLPIGISFYTFQTMSYVIDVYRQDASVQKKFTDFATFVTLFPQLIAGPIVRYKDIADQLNDRKETIDGFAYGIQLFIIGLGKKVLLANNIGLLWDQIKILPQGNLTVVEAWIGIIAFAFQIYFDFSGYSDMAIGLGKMFGFTFVKNFNYPYISGSITEFWRRWHISLGTWFREYVYFPLGGNRKGQFMTYRNLLVVWVLTGFWHGASWNFLAWGFYFAIILMLEKWFMLKVLERIPRALSHAYAIILILLGWVLFAFDNLGQGMSFMVAMFGFKGKGLFNPSAFSVIIPYIPMLLILTAASTPLASILYTSLKEKKPIQIIVPLYCMIILIICTAYLVDATYNPFLYFRF